MKDGKEIQMERGERMNEQIQDKAEMKEREAKGAGPHVLYFVGMGPGSADWITQAARQVIARTRQLFASARIRDLVLETGMELPEDPRWGLLDGRLVASVPLILEALKEGDVAVLCTGDTGVFSIASWLRRTILERAPGQAIRTIPGISSAQYFCGALGIDYHDVALVSLHGRAETRPVTELLEKRRTILFTDSAHGPQWVAGELDERGCGDWMLTCGSDLSYPNECIFKATVGEIVKGECSAAGLQKRELGLILVERPEATDSEDRASADLPGAKGSPLPLSGQGFAGGLPDEVFIRGKRPMTKSLIRSRLASVLELNGDECCWDIGAGTGSCSIEMALLCPAGRVYAIEREKEGIRLLGENRSSFGVQNIEIVHGEAPVSCVDLPTPDRVFIGGSGGSLKDIIGQVVGRWKNEPVLGATEGGSEHHVRRRRIVLTGITLETPLEAVRLLEAHGLQNIHVEQISSAHYRSLGRVHMPTVENPIWLIWADHD